MEGAEVCSFYLAILSPLFYYRIMRKSRKNKKQFLVPTHLGFAKVRIKLINQYFRFLRECVSVGDAEDCYAAFQELMRRNKSFLDSANISKPLEELIDMEIEDKIDHEIRLDTGAAPYITTLDDSDPNDPEIYIEYPDKYKEEYAKRVQRKNELYRRSLDLIIDLIINKIPVSRSTVLISSH